MLLLAEKRTYGSAVPAKNGRRREKLLREAWSGGRQRESKALCPKFSPSAVGLCAKQQKVCTRRDPFWGQRPEGNEEIAVELTVFEQIFSSPLNTAASSKWVEKFWFRPDGGEMQPR